MTSKRWGFPLNSATIWTPIATADVTNARRTATTTSRTRRIPRDAPPPELMAPLRANIANQNAIDTTSHGQIADGKCSAPVSASTIPMVDRTNVKSP